MTAFARAATARGNAVDCWLSRTINYRGRSGLGSHGCDISTALIFNCKTTPKWQARMPPIHHLATVAERADPTSSVHNWPHRPFFPIAPKSLKIHRSPTHFIASSQSVRSAYPQSISTKTRQDVRDAAESSREQLRLFRASDSHQCVTASEGLPVPNAAAQRLPAPRDPSPRVRGAIRFAKGTLTQ